jgi:hypothetical protein
MQAHIKKKKTPLEFHFVHIGNKERFLQFYQSCNRLYVSLRYQLHTDLHTRLALCFYSFVVVLPDEDPRGSKLL